MPTLTEKVRRPPQDARFQLYSVLDSIDDGVIIGDENHEIIFMNRSLREAFGDATGGLCYEFYGRSKPCPLCPIDHIARRGEKRFRYTDVEKGRCFEITANPLKNPDGSTWVIEIVRDVTEGRKVEEELRKSREEYVAVTNLTGDIIVRVDKESRWTFLNDGACKFWGKPRKKLLGVKFADYLHPDDQEKTTVAIQEVIRNKQIVRGVVNRQKTPKGWRIVEWNAAPLFDEKGEYMGLQATGRDITERQRVEEALRESEERLRGIFSSMTDGVTLVGLDGRILDCNDAVLRLHSVSRGEYVGRSVYDFIASEDRQRAIQEAPEVLEKGRLRSEVKALRKKGGTFDAEINVSLLTDASGKPTAFLGVTRDITERKKMEEELRNYAERLEELVEGRTKELRESQEKLLRAERLAAIGELAAMVGHDLRNPLQSITNAVYVLRTFYESVPTAVKERIVPKDAPKMLQIIRDEVAYANNIVSNLQDFARVQEPEVQDTDLNSVIHDALSKVKITGNIKVTARLDKTIPSLKIDPNQMTRVCSNLITNAVQAMPDGGRLTITSSRKGDFVEVEIQDTGVGIPKQNMEKIFTPLFTTKAKGVGLGLAICKNLVEAHGGSIEVESKVGKGSTVMIRVPIRRREER